MAPPSKYDNPEAVSKFLKIMRTSPSAAMVESGPQAATSSLNPETSEFSPRVPLGDKKPVPSDWEKAVPQPAAQQRNATLSRQTLSHSPFPQATPLLKDRHLDLIQDENGFVTEATAPVPFVQEPVLTPQTTNTARGPYRGSLTPTQYRLLAAKKPGFGQLTEANLSELIQQTNGYMEKVVEKFRKSHQPMALQGQANVNEPESPGVKQEASSDPDSIPFPAMDKTPIGAEVRHNINASKTPFKQDEWQQERVAVLPFNTSVAELGEHQAQDDALSDFPTFDETPVTKSFRGMELSDGNSQPPTTPTDNNVVKDEPAPPVADALGEDSIVKQPASHEGGVMVEHKLNTADAAFKHTQSPTIVVTAGIETDDSLKEDEGEEDRENLTRFEAWGTPTVRNKPRSRQRTVILSGLPRGADYSLVQSLIHGGALEGMRLVPGNPDKPTISAYVTFISADACDRYYEKYPNGFDVRHQGKKWPIFVHKRDGVDVISGMLQGYLECGATRVVKANDADDDWGIVALNKLAEGKTGARQVEAVHDTYHNGTRAITFRFASITHAVQFKGLLIRSPDWEGCHVEFTEDPCSKATGSHGD